MLESIRDKQRIIIAGSEGIEQVFEIVEKVLNYAKKPFLGFNSDDSNVDITNAPIAIIKCSEEHLMNYEHHIIVLTGIRENGDNNFENHVKNYEKLLDSSPKAGCIIYNAEDSASALIGKKERTDVVRLEYGTPDVLDKHGERSMKVETEYLPLAGLEKYDLALMKGAYTLLKRIGITEQKFIEALS